MNFIKVRSSLLWLALAIVPFAVGQQPGSAASQPAAHATDAQSDAGQQAKPKKPDHAASYYHYSMGHMYEEMAAMSGRSDYANKAINEFKLAIQNDPSSDFLSATLAEMYARTGRIRDAVLEAQDIIKRNPDNVDARKLLGRIYLRSLGDMQTGTQSQEVLKLAIEQYEAIVRIDPKDADSHLLLARLYMLNKDAAKAETELKATMQADANNEEAVTQLAYLYNEEGDVHKAIDTLNAVPESARTSKIYAALGASYEQLKDYKKAIAAFKQAVDQDHDNLDALRGLAQNLASDNQLDAALAQYKAVQDADPQDPQTALRISEIYRRTGKFELALESLKKAESQERDSIEIPYNEATILQALGRYDEAAATLQGLLDRTAKPDGSYSAGERNNRGLFLERLGNIYRDAGKIQMAIDTFYKVIALGGDDQISRGYLEIIDTYRDQKQWADATRVSEESVKKLPRDRALNIQLAEQLADEGKGDEGIHLIRAQIKGTPADRETYISLSQIYARLKRWKESDEALAQADRLSTKPEDKAYITFLRGSSYERQKKYDLAEQMFRKVLQGDPDNTQTLNYLGYMMADHNSHLEEALNLIKRAVNLDPQNGAFLDSLGWAYFKLGNYEQAEENLRRAADKTPNDPTVQDHLGELYAKTGKLKLAATHWERALNEWNRSVPADVDQQDVTRVQKKLESTRIRLAQQQKQQQH